MTVENTRNVVTSYFEADHEDVSMMAEDVVFTIMATGQEHKGNSWKNSHPPDITEIKFREQP